METALYYLALSGILTVVLWIPYILARMFLWGLPTFLNNYPEGYPSKQPTPPLWAQRAQAAHENMVETMPAFIAVLVAALLMLQSNADAIATIEMWAQVFFFSRIIYTAVFILGIPYVRTPTYLISWVAVLMIGATTLI